MRFCEFVEILNERKSGNQRKITINSIIPGGGKRHPMRLCKRVINIQGKNKGKFRYDYRYPDRKRWSKKNSE